VALVHGALEFPRHPGFRFGTVRVSRGAREYCTLCGEMIFTDKVACVVAVSVGQRWLSLHFHRACYVAWERIEQAPPAALLQKVVALNQGAEAKPDRG
jgi:hypothetical protein